MNDVKQSFMEYTANIMGQCTSRPLYFHFETETGKPLLSQKWKGENRHVDIDLHFLFGAKNNLLSVFLHSFIKCFRSGEGRAAQIFT